MADRRCRSCRLYDLPAVLSANGRVLSNKVACCLWEPPQFDLPESIAWNYSPIKTTWMEPNQGTKCPCWEPRNAS